MRLDTVCLSGLDERVKIGAGNGTFDGIAEQPSFSPNYKRTNRILAAVVIQWDFSVREKRDELWPLTECVVNRFA